jgi:hypothetical protein
VIRAAVSQRPFPLWADCPRYRNHRGRVAYLVAEWCGGRGRLVWAGDHALRRPLTQVPSEHDDAVALDASSCSALHRGVGTIPG